MNKLLRQSKTFLRRNGSTILTCVGGVGVVATAVMAVKATPKAVRLLEEAKKEKGEDLTKLETVKVAGPAYIPSILVGASTIACIFGANVLNQKQQASLMSAYALLDSSYKDYKKKVEELYGEEANGRIVEEIAKDKYEESDITVSDGKQLFYDDYSGRYFETTMEDVITAEYELNRIVTTQCGAYLNDFYELLGIEPTEYGDYLGWNAGELFDMYWNPWIDFRHEKVVMEDGLECYILTMLVEPSYDFENY